MSTALIKTPQEIEIMRKSGQIAREIIDQVVSAADVGVTTLDLENLAEKLIQKNKVKGAFKGFEGYKHNLVTCINEEVVHGIPSNRKLADGDLLTIDFGVIYQDFYSDLAETKLIGNDNAEKQQFLKTGRAALNNAIDKCILGNRLGDVGYAIQTTVEESGYNVIRLFIGHGVGRELHEPPQVPGYGIPGKGELLNEGEVIAVEVMYTMGGYEVEILPDGWTAVTKDGSLSGMFENSVAITKEGPLVLTL